MKGPILAVDLAGMLVFGGFIPPEAQDDPEGYDNYRTMDKVGYLADLLNAAVATHASLAASESPTGASTALTEEIAPSGRAAKGEQQ